MLNRWCMTFAQLNSSEAGRKIAYEKFVNSFFISLSEWNEKLFCSASIQVLKIAPTIPGLERLGERPPFWKATSWYPSFLFPLGIWSSSAGSKHKYIGTVKPVLRDHCIRDHLSWQTTQFLQKDLLVNINITKPVTRDHLSWQTTFLWPMHAYLYAYL